ncbi:MAG: DUF7666 domain-containing protein [Solimonas sp.]
MAAKKNTAVVSETTTTAAEVAPVVTSYKGFDDKLQCRGFQYQVGGTYTHDGAVRACHGGFHACEYPLNVFDYYAPAGSRFAVVEQGGKIARESGGDTKLASERITIKAEIGLPGLIKAAIEYTFSRAHPVDPNSPASATGDQGAASASGAAAVAIGTGACSKARAGADGAIVLVNRDDDGNIRHIRASKVGENGIKPDTFYTLDDNGEFEETI